MPAKLKNKCLLGLLAGFLLSGCGVMSGQPSAPLTVNETLPMTQNDSGNKLMTICANCIGAMSNLDSFLIEYDMNCQSFYKDQAFAMAAQEALITMNNNLDSLHGARSAAVYEQAYAKADGLISDMIENVELLIEMIGDPAASDVDLRLISTDLSQDVSQLKILSAQAVN